MAFPHKWNMHFDLLEVVVRIPTCKSWWFTTWHIAAMWYQSRLCPVEGSAQTKVQLNSTFFFSIKKRKISLKAMEQIKWPQTCNLLYLWRLSSCLQVGEMLARYDVEKQCAIEKRDNELAKKKKELMDDYRRRVYQQLEVYNLLDMAMVSR